MEHSQELLKKLLGEIVQRRLEFSTITVNDVFSGSVTESENYIAEITPYFEYTFNPAGEQEGFEFRVSESETKFEITIIPEYSSQIPIFCKALGLEDTVDFYDVISHDDEAGSDFQDWATESNIWSFEIEKTPELTADYDHRQLVYEAVNELRNKHTREKAEWMMKYWYMRESFMPSFEDQTEKHKIKQLMEGLPPLTVDDVINFICDLTDEQGGWELPEIIKQIEEES